MDPDRGRGIWYSSASTEDTANIESEWRTALGFSTESFAA